MDLESMRLKVIHFIFEIGEEKDPFQIYFTCEI